MSYIKIDSIKGKCRFLVVSFQSHATSLKMYMSVFTENEATVVIC